MLAVFGNAPAKLIAVVRAIHTAAIGFLIEIGIDVPAGKRFKCRSRFIRAGIDGKVFNGEISRVVERNITLCAFGKTAAPHLRDQRRAILLKKNIDIDVCHAVGRQRKARRNRQRKQKQKNEKAAFH